jgi:hypothetical protein
VVTGAIVEITSAAVIELSGGLLCSILFVSGTGVIDAVGCVVTEVVAEAA